MAGSSEEYLASLGFDTSDVDKAVSQTITLLGHLGNQFDGLSRKAESAGRALTGSSQGVKAVGASAKASSADILALKEQIYGQADAYTRVTAATKTAVATEKDRIQASQQAIAGIDRMSSAYDKRIAAERKLSGEQSRSYQTSRQLMSAWDQQYNALVKSTTPIQDNVQNLARMRYALYDVSRAFTVLGVATVAFGAIAYKTAIDYQRDFANVIRTTGATGDAADKLRDQLIGISQTNPISFSDVTQIATLAGQLNVATNSVAAFSKISAQFSATTNVAITDSATAFARLDALLPDVNQNYQKLADSILNVGVNSVATESQIITIVNRIAGIGSTVGFTSDQVIGLAGALASLGVQPELAQGTVTRLFTKIQDAVTNGGASLEYFAQISKTSASEFASSWRNAPDQTLIRLLDGINAGGPEAIKVIQNFGLAGSRDIPTLLKLAQNTDVLSESFYNAANAAGTLDSQYSVIADTVASKLQVLGNNFQAFLAALGSSATLLGGTLDTLNGFLRWATAMASNPVSSTIIAIGVALTTIVGISALAVAAFLRVAATAAAIRTATAEAGAGTNILKAAFDLLTPSALKAAAAGEAVAASNVAVATTSKTAAGATAAAGGGVSKLTSGFKGLAGAAFGIPGLLVAIGFALTSLVSAAAGNIAGSIFDGITGGAQAAAEAVRASTTSVQDFSGVLSQLDPGAQTIANYLRNLSALAGPLGLGVANAVFDQTTRGVQQLDEAMSTAAPLELAASYEQLVKQAADVGLSAEDIAAKFPLATAAYEALGGAQGAAEARTQALNDAFDAQVDTLKDSINAILDVASATNQIESSMYQLGQGLGQSGADFSQFSEAGRANIAALSAIIKAYTEDAGGNADVLAGNLRGLFNAVVAGGYASASALSLLSQAITATGSNAPATWVDITSLIAGYTDGTKKAATETRNFGGAAGGAAKQVRTLVDYANDLSSTFKRAFDIRYGPQRGLDQIRSGWNDVREAAADAAREMAEAQATLQGLASDRSIKEYWLSVAENYGDEKRAAQLRADLAKNSVDTAKAQDDLTKAQQKNSKVLTGNSAAAAANRETLLGIIQSNQDYLTALAASGASQAKLETEARRLKDSFIEQATALGFNRSEVEKFARSFDDMSKIIARAPKNITVKANVNPALQALNELDAKARGLGGKTYAGPKITMPKTPVLDPNLRDAMFAQWINDFRKEYGRNPYQTVGQLAQLRKTWDRGLLGEFRKGTDWTGSGNPWEVAGVVHNREAVLNERANQMIPSQFINAANQGRNPWQYAPQQTKVSMPSTMVVELSPVDRAIFAQGKPVVVTISSDNLANSTAAANDDDNRRGGA